MLAIAAWEKGASWRAPGRAGENGNRSDTSLEGIIRASGGSFTFPEALHPLAARSDT